MKNLYPYIFTIFVGIVGAFLASIVMLPLPWILGPIIFVSLVSRFQSLPLKNPKTITPPARVVLGITIGSTFTPHIIEQIDQYLYSLLFIIPMVFFIGLVGTWYYHKIQKFDKMSAYFSSMPGGLLEMVIVGKEMGADMSKVVLTQSTRLFLVVSTLPFVVEHLSHRSLRTLAPITKPLSQVPLQEMALMVVVGIVGVFFAKKVKLFGPYILGPMFISIAAYSFGLIHARPPDEIIKMVQIIIGTSIGFTFYGVTFKTILKTVFSTLGYFVILLIICGSIVAIVHNLLHFPLLPVILAFSPGGQADISLMAIIVGLNVPYIILHHIIRLFLVISFASVFAKRLRS